MHLLNDVGIASQLLRQVPEFQIHLCRWIMRETTQHYLSLLWLRKIAQQPARNSLAPQPNGQHWRYSADDLHEISCKMLCSSQAFFAREAGRDEACSPYTLSGLLYPLHSSLRPEQCLKGVERCPSFLKHGTNSAYQKPALRRNEREAWIADYLLENRR